MTYNDHIPETSWNLPTSSHIFPIPPALLMFAGESSSRSLAWWIFAMQPAVNVQKVSHQAREMYWNGPQGIWHYMALRKHGLFLRVCVHMCVYIYIISYYIYFCKCMEGRGGTLPDLLNSFPVKGSPTASLHWNILRKYICLTSVCIMVCIFHHFSSFSAFSQHFPEPYPGFQESLFHACCENGER